LSVLSSSFRHEMKSMKISPLGNIYFRFCHNAALMGIFIVRRRWSSGAGRGAARSSFPKVQLWEARIDARSTPWQGGLAPVKGGARRRISSTAPGAAESLLPGPLEAIMAKPTCKAESRWKYWREENPKASKDKFRRWAKMMMTRARRRFLKVIEPVI
jgi:hypothetical protein